MDNYEERIKTLYIYIYVVIIVVVLPVTAVTRMSVLLTAIVEMPVSSTCQQPLFFALCWVHPATGQLLYCFLLIGQHITMTTC